MLGWNIDNMTITFNDEIWMWALINSKGDCLACVEDIDLANALSQMYQEQEDEYYNNVDFQDDGPRHAYGYL